MAEPSREENQIRQFVAAEILAFGGSSAKIRAFMIAKAALFWLADDTGQHAIELGYQLTDQITNAGRD